MGNKPKLHFLLVYPLNTAPSQRFRFEQFFPVLTEHNIPYSTNCFYDNATFSALYKGNNKLALALRMLLCFFRRVIHMTTLGGHQKIFIQRGAAPFGPPIFEWIIRYIWHIPIIYDFDDAIWLHPEKKASFLKRLIKSYYKVGKICTWAEVVVTGNEYLAHYARRFNKNVQVIPTVVDTENKFFPLSPHFINKPIVIGWTGSHTTLLYLEKLEPVLMKLKQEIPFSLVVIANKEPRFKELEYRFSKWSEEAEVNELQKIDIGIMPLPGDEWTSGKCGFKAIQYMAIGKPAIVSAVGVNSEIVTNGVNGFTCSSDEEWLHALRVLMTNENLLKSFGVAARLKIESGYSLKKATQFWCKVIKIKNEQEF